MDAGAFLGAFAAAFGALLDPSVLLAVLVGTLFGLVVGAIPGLGSLMGIALLVPFTFGMETTTAIVLLTAVKGGSNFGGSITAILINTPGQPPSAATLLDGYPMAKNGEAGRALGASATASVSGAAIGILVLVVTVPVMREVVLWFGSPEVFWLGVWGLTFIAVVVRGSVVSGLISAGLGLIVALHGASQLTAQERWTYGLLELYDGFHLVPVLVGLFAIAEMMDLVLEGGTISDDDESSDAIGAKWQGVKDVFVNKFLLLRSGAIGSLIGIIPGVGGTTATYVSYFQAAQTASDSDSFGSGDVRGVIASEAANDAKDGAAFIPTLALGIPGSAAMAVLLGALVLHGIQPGPALVQDHLDVIVLVVVALLVSNVLTSVIGLAIIDHLARIARIDVDVLGPIVIVFSYVGTYVASNSVFSVLVTFLFGVVGFLMIRADVSRVPMILAVVLAPIVEINFFRSLASSESGLLVFVQSPISMVLCLLVVTSLLLPVVRPTLADRSEVVDR